MRSALALSALLLLLPSPLPSLSGAGAQDSSSPTPTSNPTGHVVLTTATQIPTVALGSQSTSPAPQVSSSGSGAAPTQQSTVTVVTGKDGQATSGAITTPAGSPTKAPGPGQTTPTPIPTPTTKPETTRSQHGIQVTAHAGTQSSHDVTTSIMTTKDGNQTVSQPPQVVNPPDTSSSGPALATPAGTQPPAPGPGTLTCPGSAPQGPNQTTPASGGPGTAVGGAGTPRGTPPPPVTTPPVTSQGWQPTSSKVPAITGTRSSVTGTLSSVTGTSPPATLRPAAPSSGPVATSPVGPAAPSTQLAPTVPQDSIVPTRTSVLKTGTISCEPPQKQNEKTLLLNLTKSSLCAQNPDDKLVTLLCRAAKANFNSSRDQCHIQLAPVPESQAVAVKKITVQTSLLPEDLYESLTDQWDDLKKAGVSDMRFGGRGPPEETEDRFSMPLIITIVAMASFLLLVAGLYGCCHQRLSQRKDQQRLTEELQTMENGYHDNPTLEVMETSSEMQEKKVVSLNGELGDSWIVPLDNLIKDDLDEEEDTHL